MPKYELCEKCIAPYQGSLDHYAREAGQDLGETLQQNKRDSAVPRGVFRGQT